MNGFEFKNKYYSKFNVILPNEETEISGELIFVDQPVFKLDRIPRIIYGNLVLNSCQISSVKELDNIEVTGSLKLINCGLTDFPIAVQVGKTLDLEGNLLTKIPESLKDHNFKELNLSKNKIESLINLPVKINHINLEDNCIKELKGLSSFEGESINLMCSSLPVYNSLPPKNPNCEVELPISVLDECWNIDPLIAIRSLYRKYLIKNIF